MPPVSLIDSLQSVRRKVRALAITAGMGVAVAAAIGLLIAVVLLDWSLGLDKLPRLLLMISAGVSLLYVLWHWLAQPAMAKLEIGDVAGRLEHTYPQFDDRLRSTVNFVQDQIPGSRSMQDRVVAEANAMAQTLDLNAVILRRPVYFAMAGAVSSLLVLAALISWGGHSHWLSIAANRLMLGDDRWPRSVEIVLEDASPERVPVGQRITIRIRLAKGDKDSRKATIFYRYDNGPWEQELMTRKDGVYSALLDARLEPKQTSASLQVHIEAGDDDKTLVPIAVVPRLDVARVQAIVIPPAYVQPSIPTTVNLVERPAIMAIGSTVSLSLNFNKPLNPNTEIVLRPVKDNVKTPVMTWDRSASTTAVAHFAATTSFRFTVKATDTDGFQNAGGEEFELIAKEDQPPTVQIEEPKRSEERPRLAGFDVKAVAEDDYGILGARVVVDRVNGGEKSADPAQKPAPAGTDHWVIDLLKDGKLVNESGSWEPADSSADLKRYRLGYHWELSTLANANLKHGDVLEFYMQVKDNFLLNGHDHDWVSSGKLRITIITQDEWENMAAIAAEQIQMQIKAQHMSELRQKAEGETLKQGLDRNKKFDAADKSQANRLANDQASTQSQTMQLAERLEQLVQKMNENKSPEGGLKATADQVQKDLKQAADGAMRDAKSNLDRAKDPPQDPKATPEQSAKDAEQRSSALAKASEGQQNAADQLQKAMDKLGQMGGLAEAIKKIESIRADQEKVEKDFQKDNKENIGKTPDQLSKADQERNKKEADQQNDLAKQLEQALNNMDAKADKMQKSDPSASQAMKQAAQVGKEQALTSKQQQAAQKMQENQQADAQQNQRQVELGLDQILNKLHEAERKQLEELSRQLAQLQQLVAELLRRQAGHNIDNLLIQGGAKRLAQVESKERDELIDLSGRDPKDMPPVPQLAQLTPSQEQTQRNTADIAKQAETLPDPAPAAKLTQAAGQMERAIVHLRDSKPVDAYKPPMVDALATLLEARKQIDDAAKKVQDKLDEKNAESIKEAYVKLLEEQKKIGFDLLRIDRSPKDTNGDLPREISVKLGQLPTSQGKLMEKAQKIGEELDQLGSIVFNWANKDILKSMGEVKDNLAKPDTGKPTQVAEKQTEDQLQAMIDSLVEKINKSKFDQRSSGGKGGGSGSPQPKLPTEAELRLLKKNQEAINVRTIDADQQKEKDKQSLQELGAREGDIRNLLDQLIQKASQGKQKLAPEPDPKDQLPEEVSKEDVDNQEIQDDLLHDKVDGKTVDKGVKLTGDRMGRVRQRLAINVDPGKVTQEIEKRINVDLDDLIKMAQQQQSQSQSKPGSGKSEKMGQPKPEQQQGPQQANKGNQPNKKGQQSAGESVLTQGNKPQADLSGDVKEAMEEWGRITGRDRAAVQEGAGDQVIGKYKKFVEDYYRSLAEQASKR